jgi:hypothetical protein
MQLRKIKWDDTLNDNLTCRRRDRLGLQFQLEPQRRQERRDPDGCGRREGIENAMNDRRSTSASKNLQDPLRPLLGKPLPLVAEPS